MEIEGKDGSKTRVKPGSTIQFGRGHGFNSTNRTVSRRHITFQMDHRRRTDEEPTLHFEVTGRNPIWVHSQKTGKVETFKRFGNGEMENGDMVCVSAENPIWFTVRKVELEEENERSVKRELGLENELAYSLESSAEPEKVEELDIEDVDISNIDPVKEFGLVVMGHEFDGYAKKMIRDARKWEWFIEEPGAESEDDDVEEKRRKKRPRRRKKKGEENDDEEWAGEREEEEDNELLSKSRKFQKPVYSTRSKDRNKPIKDRRNAKPSSQGKSTQDVDEDVEDEDEDDETLGGFIVDDVSEEEDVMDEDDQEEEEEFVEDEDEE